MWESVIDYSQIIIADLILSGDNALIIGMAAAGLSPELRKKAILYGMVIAAVLRIVFAVIATKLLGIPGILFVGALLLFWVCWRLFVEIREGTDEHAMEAMEDADGRWHPPLFLSRLRTFPCLWTMFWRWLRLQMGIQPS